MLQNEYPKIAVLLAAYNGMAYIQEQLDSILQQTNVTLSIFISVDLSSDKTFDWCSDLAKRESRISVLPYGERFGGAAANFFRLIREVDFSHFDFVALSDQDDIWLSDKLFMACSHIQNQGVDAYSSNALAFWKNGREMLINKAQAFRKYDYLFEAAGPGCTYVLSTKPLLLFKEQLLLKQSLVTKIALHDWLLYAFFRSHGFSWYIDNDYKIHYRQHDGNQVGVNRGWSASIKRLGMFTSGWYREQVENIMKFTGITSPNFKSKWVLLQNSNQLRRKLSDRIVLFMFVVFGLY